VKDYSTILALRARFAQPRAQEEETADYFQQRNNALLSAWRVRYHQRVTLPEPWRTDGEKFYRTWSLSRARERAQAWLDRKKLEQREQKIRAARNVLTLKRKAK